jgi:hypothetical protein
MKLRQPGSLKIDRIDEYHAGHRIQHTGRNQILDFFLRFFFHPRIDLQPRSFAVVVIHRKHIRPEMGANLRKKFLEKYKSLMRPDRVRRRPRYFAILLDRFQCGPQSAKQRRHLFGCGRIHQHGFHLCRRLLARSHIRHTQCGRDTVGRKKQIARFTCELLV